MIAAGFDHLVPSVLSDDIRRDINDVLDAAHEWDTGSLPWTLAAGVGDIDYKGRPSNAYSRFVALRFSPPSDPRRQSLRCLIDHILRQSGVVITRQGLALNLEDVRTYDMVDGARWANR